LTTRRLSINFRFMKNITSRTIRIKVNEKEVSLSGPLSLLELKDRYKPDADVVIFNGFPLSSDHPLREGDEVCLIRKGETPSREELECLMMARHTPGVHEKMKKAVVGVAGLGGLGASVAIALARVGVGTLILVDFDVVEPSNLNRQQYFFDQVGMAKTEALSQNLLRINPFVTLRPSQERIEPENVQRLFQDADVLVEALDRADQKAMLINAVSEKLPGKYLVAASGVAGYGGNNEIQTVRFSSNIFIVGDQKTEARPGSGLMAPRVGIAAHHQANTVLRILLGEEK
jgi:sulfur carrier protein ThiS adenylyltransferase